MIEIGALGELIGLEVEAVIATRQVAILWLSDNATGHIDYL